MKYRPGAHTSAWHFWLTAGRGFRRGTPLDAKRLLVEPAPLTEEKLQSIMLKLFKESKPSGRYI